MDEETGMTRTMSTGTCREIGSREVGVDRDSDAGVEYSVGGVW